MIHNNQRRHYRRAVLALLEQEVKYYPATVKKLAEIKEGLIMDGGTGEPGVVRGGGHGDPTARKAMTLCASYEITYMSHMVQAIERGRSEFCAKDTLQRMRFVELRFWDCSLTTVGIAQRLDVSEQTVVQWRIKFLELVAMYAGWRLAP